MFDELWSEIQDSQGEIFDVIEYKEEWEKEEKFDVEKYINGNTDYWFTLTQTHTKIMLQFETEKGELNLLECWIDEDYSERYEDGERDLIWIDRIHEDKYETIDEFVEEKFAGISDTIYIEIHAIRNTDVTVFEEGDEYYDLFPDNISIEEMGDDCLGGNSYVWENSKLRKRCEEYVWQS